MSNHAEYISLDDQHGVWRYRLPEPLCPSNEQFEQLWNLHPNDFPAIFLHGRQVSLPRWQQAYGKGYYFSGQLSQALTIPALLQPYLIWSQQHIDSRLNGMLLNWYDGHLGHYIGAHRDSEVGLVAGSVIAMISLGESRIVRFRPNQGLYQDVQVDDSDVLVINLATNQAYKHEVPKFKRFQGRRISITLRCFKHK